MNFQDCIEFIKEVPACTMCTMEGDQPRGRGMAPLWVREDGVYFTTAPSKDLYTQLKANPKVELCFVSPKPKHLRITGEVEFIEDQELKQQAMADRPFLKAFVAGGDKLSFILFRIPHGEAHFWLWENNTKEAEIPKIRF